MGSAGGRLLANGALGSYLAVRPTWWCHLAAHPTEPTTNCPAAGSRQIGVPLLASPQVGGISKGCHWLPFNLPAHCQESSAEQSRAEMRLVDVSVG